MAKRIANYVPVSGRCNISNRGRPIKSPKIPRHFCPSFEIKNIWNMSSLHRIDVRSLQTWYIKPYYIPLRMWWHVYDGVKTTCSAYLLCLKSNICEIYPYYGRFDDLKPNIILLIWIQVHIHFRGNVATREMNDKVSEECGGM